MRRHALIAVAIAILLAVTPVPARAQLNAELVTGGLAQPVAFAQDPSDPSIQLVAEQAGRLRVLVDGVLQATDFLDLRGVVASGGERGLLGVAFAPDYAISGRVFVHFTDTAGNSVVARFTRSIASPLVGDPTSRFDLHWPGGATSIAQPFANHNGGHLAFGPDGYLYIGLGDGGNGNDPMHRAQDPATLLGKMLRIDVSVPDTDAEGYDIPPDNPFLDDSTVLSEIWAFGLRNPWRYSFDDPDLGGTGALVIADVGQATWEEIDYEPALTGGRNYGWRNREGAHPNDETLPAFPIPLTDPIWEYDHTVGQSITGGYVYRGSSLGALFQGRYFYGDIVAGRIWSLGLSIDGAGEATVADIQEHTDELGAAISPSSFGVDTGGEIYVLDYGLGRLYRLALAPGGGAGCAPPDPFASLGGGTCVNGGWLPPGFGPPGTGGTPPPPPPGGSEGCATPDPFLTLGGGTCANGGWLPPGITPPASGGDTPPPTAPPPGGSTDGCTTPDPFVTLGGGTCANGGWLPPGIEPPPGGGSGPTPTEPPPGETTPGGCTLPDPFASLGGGTCVNGGWLPPGFPEG